MLRRIARLLCRFGIHILVIHDGVAVDLGRTDKPRTCFNLCACGRRMEFRKPER